MVKLEGGSRRAMRRCDGEAQLFSSQRNNTALSTRLIDELILSRRIDECGVDPSATPLRSCMSAFGRPGCRPSSASMEEEERPSATGGRAVPVNSRAPKSLMLRPPVRRLAS
jgi:hypothetical protein